MLLEAPLAIGELAASLQSAPFVAMGTVVWILQTPRLAGVGPAAPGTHRHPPLQKPTCLASKEFAMA